MCTLAPFVCTPLSQSITSSQQTPFEPPRMEAIIKDACRVHDRLLPTNMSEHNRMRAAQRLRRLFDTFKTFREHPKDTAQNTALNKASMGLIVTLLRQPPWTEPLLRLLLFVVIACMETHLSAIQKKERASNDESTISAVANSLDTYFKQPYWTLQVSTPANGTIVMHSVVDDSVVRSHALVAAQQMLNLPSVSASVVRVNLERLCTAYTCALRSLILKKGLTSILPSGGDSPQAAGPPATERLAERLEAIANAAEGDMGRMAFKDLVLSFRLPRSAVGVRRGLLLNKQVHTVARKEHTSLVHDVHSLAMLGALAVWNGKDRARAPETDASGNAPLFAPICATPEEREIHRSCALLSGLAMLLSSGNQEDIINGIAFEGRVFLPFLFDMSSCAGADDADKADEAKGCPPGAALERRLFFDGNRWVLCRLEQGKLVDVVVSGHGLEGLCLCAVTLLDAEQAFAA